MELNGIKQTFCHKYCDKNKYSNISVTSNLISIIWIKRSAVYGLNLTISYRARERALWKRANSRRSWMVMTSFQRASSTMPINKMLPTTAKSTVMAFGAIAHSVNTQNT